MFEDFSGLRFAGLIAGLIFLLVAGQQYRRYNSGGRLATIAMMITGLLLIMVSAIPELGRIPAEALSLGDMVGGPIIALLLIATVFAWALIFYGRYNHEFVRTRLNNTIHALSLKGYFDENPDRRDSAGDAIYLVIPAYNEGNSIGEVLSSIPETVCGFPLEVLVVDDGSADGTGDKARAAGASVLTMPVNSGQGSALRSGYSAAVQCGAKFVVTLDADGSNQPKELEKILQPLIDGEADICIGSRVLGDMEHTSVLRTVGMYIFNVLMSIVTGVRITDCASSFRAFTADVLRDARLLQEQYQCTEIVIDSAKRGYRITERPIQWLRRQSGETKKAPDLLYGLFFLRTIIKTWLR